MPAAQPALLAALPGLAAWACPAEASTRLHERRWPLLQPFLRFALKWTSAGAQHSCSVSCVASRLLASHAGPLLPSGLALNQCRLAWGMLPSCRLASAIAHCSAAPLQAAALPSHPRQRRRWPELPAGTSIHSKHVLPFSDVCACKPMLRVVSMCAGCSAAFATQAAQALVRAACRRGTGPQPVQRLLTQHLLTARLEEPGQLAAVSALPADLVDLTALCSRPGDELDTKLREAAELCSCCQCQSRLMSPGSLLSPCFKMCMWADFAFLLPRTC